MKKYGKYFVYLSSIPFCIWFYFCLPEPLFDVPYSTIIVDKDGSLLSAATSADGQWRFPISDSIPEKFENCILSFEDQYFYSHLGVNPVSIVKAFYQNLKTGKIERGGSTISMQVIRLSRHGKSRTYVEKLYEILLAVRLELRFSKNEILRLYSAHAPFGGNVIGLESASWRYYGRSSDLLSWGETATLAVLPNAPSLIYPGKNHELLLIKRNRLIDKLVELEIIDSTDAELAKDEPLPDKPKPLPNIASHLLSKYQISNPNGGYVSTTLDKSYQYKIDRIVNQHSKNLGKNHIYNAAALVIETKTGKVISYIGNSTDKNNGHENAVDIISSPRSSGSTLKPFLYERMLSKGQLLPTTLLPDIPTYISGYSPKNFDESFGGAVHANDALARSLNIPAVRMLQNYGVEIFHNDLQNLEFHTINRTAGNYGLSLILGGAEVTLWDLVKNYRHLAIQTLYPFNIPEEVNDIHLGKNNIKYNKSYIEPGAAWLTLDALKEMERPIEGANWNRFESNKLIAWKTGTSFGHRDAWAVGVTPDYIVGVWVGNADGEGRPGLTGASTAAPLMFTIHKILPGNAWFAAPESGLIDMEVCKLSGHKPSQYCEELEKRKVLRQAEESDICPYHKQIYLDKTGAYRVNSECYSVSEMEHKNWFVLPPIMEWYYKRISPFYRELPTFLPTCYNSTQSNIDIIYPQPNAKIFIPRDLSGEKQKLVLDATTRNNKGILYWHLNEEYLGFTSVNHQMEVLLKEGLYKLTIVSQTGESLSRSFSIVSR